MPPISNFDDQADDVRRVAVAEDVDFVQESVGGIRQAFDVVRRGVGIVQFGGADKMQAQRHAAGSIGVVGGGHPAVHRGFHLGQTAGSRARLGRPEHQHVHLRFRFVSSGRRQRPAHPWRLVGTAWIGKHSGLGKRQRILRINLLQDVGASAFGADRVGTVSAPQRAGQDVAVHHQHHAAFGHIGDPAGQRVARRGGRTVFDDDAVSHVLG